MKMYLFARSVSPQGRGFGGECRSGQKQCGNTGRDTAEENSTNQV